MEHFLEDAKQLFQKLEHFFQKTDWQLFCIFLHNT